MVGMWYNRTIVSDTRVPQESELLETLRERAQADVDRCQQELEAAKRAHTLALERLSHIQALLELNHRVADGLLDPPAHSTPSAQGERVAAPDSRAVDAAFALLQNRGSGLHYREIYSEIERQGILIRGASPANTLLTRMLRDGRFRPAGPRGFYEIDPKGGHRHFRPTRQRARGAA